MMDGSIGHHSKKKIKEIVKGFPLDMNIVNAFADLNIIPSHSYDVLVGMDWLDTHHAILDCHDKTFTCLNEEGKQTIVKGIPRPISTREISSLQLMRCVIKRY